MLEIGYGHTVSSLEDDKFIKLVENGVRRCLTGSGAGASLVDFFPIRAVYLPFLPVLALNLRFTLLCTVRHVPAWMPGMEFKRSAAIARVAVRDMEEVPYRNVVEAMASAPPTHMVML